jgi:hypothetical protein
MCLRDTEERSTCGTTSPNPTPPEINESCAKRAAQSGSYGFHLLHCEPANCLRHFLVSEDFFLGKAKTFLPGMDLHPPAEQE